MALSDMEDRRPQWHRLYYVLAIINVLTILGSLYLNHTVIDIHRESVEGNQVWAYRLSGLLELAALAQGTNAPGIDIFDSRDVERETKRRDAALKAFDARIVSLKRELLESGLTPDSRSLLGALDGIQIAMDNVVSTAELIFIHVRNNDMPRGTHYMATMERAYGDLARQIGAAQRLVHSIQAANSTRQLTDASHLGRLELISGGVIVAIISIVVFYGHRMARAFKAAEAERQRLVAALKASEQKAQGRLADAIESINGGFVLFDAEDRLVMCNQAYRDMYPATADLNVPGVRFEDLIRADVARGQVPEAAGREEEWLAERLRTHLAGQSTSEQQLADGRWIVVNEQRTSEGGVVGIRTDITARKRTELELRRALDELREATEKLARQERLSMLGQVAGTVSHELRNPLSAIRNSMALLRQMIYGKVPGVERPIDRIDRNIDRCARIIDDILDFTRVRELQRETVALDAWLQETLGEIAVPAGVAVRCDLCFASEISIDRARMRQVVVNLVDNAAQALSDPGWTPTDARQRRIEVRTEAAGPFVRLLVSDNGPGIAAERLPKIFEPLFTTKSFGVGLGLPTVRQIVDQHGGTIDVESTVDVGTTFSIWLPRQAAPAATGAADKPEPKAAAS